MRQLTARGGAGHEKYRNPKQHDTSGPEESEAKEIGAGAAASEGANGAGKTKVHEEGGREHRFCTPGGERGADGEVESEEQMEKEEREGRNNNKADGVSPSPEKSTPSPEKSSSASDVDDGEQAQKKRKKEGRGQGKGDKRAKGDSSLSPDRTSGDPLQSFVSDSGRLFDYLKGAREGDKVILLEFAKAQVINAQASRCKQAVSAIQQIVKATNAGIQLPPGLMKMINGE